MSGALGRLLAVQCRAQRPRLVRAALLAALVSAASVALLGISGWFITAAALAGAAGSVAAMAFNYMLPSAAIRLFAILRTGARYGEALASHEAALGAVAAVRPALFRSIAAMPAHRALAFSSGDTVSRIVNDVTAIEHDLVRRSAPAAALAALASGTILIAIAGIPAALAVAVILVLTLLLARRVSQRLDAPVRAAMEANGALKQALTRLVESAPDIRCYGLEALAARHVAERSAPLAQAQVEIARANGWLSFLHIGAIALAAVTALVLAAPAGAPLAALAALAAAMTIDGAAPLFRREAARAALLHAEARLEAVAGNDGASAQEPLLIFHRPAVRILHGPLLAPGSRTAIAGRSGSGKTTLVEILLGLRAAKPGMAWLDGVDVAFLDAETLRRTFAWAPQDAGLIAGTVRDNLRLAAPGAPDAALWSALADAMLSDRVHALPHGLDSWIGGNGERLSGGERRRLALARAYLSDAAWLLLDEPTENLDPETERRVIERLANRLDRTGQGLLLVSHRAAPRALCTAEIAIAAPGALRLQAAARA